MTFGTELPEAQPQPTRPTEINVCVGTCCYTKGSYDLFQAFYREIAARKLENAVSLQATFCLENCQGSPCIKIGDKVLGEVSPDRAADLLADL